VYTQQAKRSSLLRYWTTRYALTLVIGLAIILIVSVLWIRHSTLENNLNLNKYMAEEIADRMENSIANDSGGPLKIFPNILEDRSKILNSKKEPSLYIVNENGKVIFSNVRSPGVINSFVSSSFFSSKDTVKKFRLDSPPYDIYVVKSAIEMENGEKGWVLVVQPEKELTEVHQEYSLLLIMIISLGLLGWGAIYFLSRKLTSPIQDVSKAAKRIEAGLYDVNLSENVPQQEMYELIHSFKEMAQKLERLESLRAELLAGVTHELKTPVTSISGLLQAVKDDVVTGEEAKEFLDISVKETSKLQNMIGDLLDFNAFTAQAIPINIETHDALDLVKEITYQWHLAQGNEALSYDINATNKSIIVDVDPMRFQQIMTNLLNNAKHAMKESGHITIECSESLTQLLITVTNNGPPISEEEQPFIFDRFFRGEKKKYEVRGLGLGLPFSQMLARAMNGDLFLQSSSNEGTSFTITLPLHTD
jgi:signal transduction histidine kinase